MIVFDLFDLQGGGFMMGEVSRKDQRLIFYLMYRVVVERFWLQIFGILGEVVYKKNKLNFF